MFRAQIIKIIGWLSLAVIVLGIAWYFMHPRATDAMMIVECRQHYAQARNQVDTLRIDGLVPERAGRASSAMRCGDLRHAYPEVTPRQ
jgi:hypothetical protein